MMVNSSSERSELQPEIVYEHISLGVFAVDYEGAGKGEEDEEVVPVPFVASDEAAVAADLGDAAFNDPVAAEAFGGARCRDERADEVYSAMAKMMHIGKPMHLAMLSGPDLLEFIRRTLKRHDDARLLTRTHVTAQAHQLHALRNAHVELLARKKPSVP